jgi:DNA-binding response OmpR family regulator
MDTLGMGLETTMNATVQIMDRVEHVVDPTDTIVRQEADPKHKTGGKILIVDDEPDVIRALMMRLTFAGYEVIAASDGASATKAAIVSQPDVIILDIGMPCGDGHTVARRLSENISTLFIPIIFLTARASQVDKDLAADVGAADYITKPFTSERLLAAVKRALNRREQY